MNRPAPATPVPASSAGAAKIHDIGVSGVAERLDTGEKHLFRNGAELLELMLGGRAGPKVTPQFRHPQRRSECGPGR
jgi:hypothetical protein